MRYFALLIGLGLAGCGSGPLGSQTFGLVAPASGQVTVQNGGPSRAISGVVFSNEGSAGVTIDGIQVVLASGQTIDGMAGIGVAAGSQVTYLFDSKSTHQVASLTFVVHGSTEKLVVLDTEDTGVVPQGCSLSAASYDQSCTKDADCVPVYQGSVCGNYCRCPNAAINGSDLTQYQTDYSAEAQTASACNCPLIPTPKCVNAACTLN